MELLLQQLGLRLSAFTVDRPEPNFDVVSNDYEQPSSDDDSDVSEDGGDSDLEYWWKIALCLGILVIDLLNK
jgi:hypothetical protein